MREADYLAGVPTLPDSILRKLASDDPLSAAEEEFATLFLKEHVKPALNERLIETRRYVRDGDPTRPHLRNAKTSEQPYKPHRRYCADA
jgi:hypothetical protein